MTRNVFEANEPDPSVDEEFIKSIAGDYPHVRLPPLQEGFSYEIKNLPSGHSAVVIAREVDGMESEPKFGEYTADKLNSPESRTLRHRD